MKGPLPFAFALWVVLQTSVAWAALPNGDKCQTGSECTSGFCVDDVCCDSACDGICQACSGVLKQSGIDSGVCGPVRAGTDPGDDCAAEAQATCGQTGQCAGSSAKCALYPTGTACGATSCVLNNTTGMVCNGAGTCYPETTPLPCESGKYACLPDGDAGVCTTPCPGHCASPCTQSSDCTTAGDVCLGGACVAKRANGAECTQPSECLSSNCVDGVCCDKPCAGQCEACKQPGSEGKCVPVVKAPPVAPRPACSGSGACEGICDGKVDGCTYPDNATTCGAASCSGDSLVPAPVCDGTGQCAQPTTQDCGDYTCDATAGQCNTSCTTNAECAGGRECNVALGACVEAGATCADEWTVKSVGGTLSSCGGYRCVAGKCQQQCSGAADCAPDYECSGSQCKTLSDAGGATGGSGGMDAGADAGPSAPAAEDDGGCGCRTAPAPERSGAWWMIGTLFAWRRRRASRASGKNRRTA